MDRHLNKFFLQAMVMMLIFALAGCSDSGQKQQEAAKKENGITKAVAEMQPTEGNTAKGMVMFTKEEGGIRITAEIDGLAEGVHGFHIHDKGDCSAPDGTSAGGHFNPAGVDHAGPDAEKRHVGDLGNITADENGKATYDRLDTHVTFEGDHSIIGRGLIIHAKADDLTSQPTGAAGARLACGVIEKSN